MKGPVRSGLLRIPRGPEEGVPEISDETVFVLCAVPKHPVHRAGEELKERSRLVGEVIRVTEMHSGETVWNVGVVDRLHRSDPGPTTDIGALHIDSRHTHVTQAFPAGDDRNRRYVIRRLHPLPAGIQFRCSSSHALQVETDTLLASVEEVLRTREPVVLEAQRLWLSLSPSIV